MATSISSILLLLVNLLPIGGVLWFDWSVLEILLLYWTESVSIGLVNVLRMSTCLSGNLFAGYVNSKGDLPPAAAAALETAGAVIPPAIGRLILIPFFVIHYGIFCFAHAMAVIMMLADYGAESAMIETIVAIATPGFWIAAGGIFLSHLSSFFVNFLGRGENKRTGLATLMTRPYGRIVIMHITIIAGGAFVMWLGNPLPALIVLVTVKAALDLRLHRRERRAFAA